MTTAHRNAAPASPDCCSGLLKTVTFLLWASKIKYFLSQELLKSILQWFPLIFIDFHWFLNDFSWLELTGLLLQPHRTAAPASLDCCSGLLKTVTFLLWASKIKYFLSQEVLKSILQWFLLIFIDFHWFFNDFSWLQLTGLLLRFTGLLLWPPYIFYCRVICIDFRWIGSEMNPSRGLWKTPLNRGTHGGGNAALPR